MKVSKDEAKKKVLEGLIEAMNQAIPDEALPTKEGEAMVIDMRIGKVDEDKLREIDDNEELDPRLKQKIKESLSRK